VAGSHLIASRSVFGRGSVPLALVPTEIGVLSKLSNLNFQVPVGRLPSEIGLLTVLERL
jgi:hypothetical protein